MSPEIHGHEVLAMMEGNAYTRDTLLAAILDKFGAEARFCTCSASGMSAAELIQFLEARGKFCPTEGGFTVDVTKRCNH